MRGRKPKATILKLLTGNPGGRPLNVNEPVPEGDLRDPPAWFSPRQRILWDIEIKNAPEGLLRLIDSTILEVYIVSKSVHEEAAENISKYGSVVKAAGREYMRNPYVSVLNQAAATMLKAASEMGFSPSSRSRVSVKGRRKNSTSIFARLKEMDFNKNV